MTRNVVTLFFWLALSALLASAVNLRPRTSPSICASYECTTRTLLGSSLFWWSPYHGFLSCSYSDYSCLYDPTSGNFVIYDSWTDTGVQCPLKPVCETTTPARKRRSRRAANDGAQ